MHRAARWIDQGDIDGALEGRYLPVAGHSLVADPLASAGHKIISDRSIGDSIGRHRRWRLRLQGRIWMHLQPQTPKRVVDKHLHDPGRCIELVDDG